MKASNAASASLLVSAIQISCNDRLAFGCCRFGSLLRTLAVLCTQQRCSRVVGHSSASAFQKPSAPSATASSGATAKPRFCKSSSSSRQSCALSRAPSVKPTSSFLPSGVAPMMTRDHPDMLGQGQPGTPRAYRSGRHWHPRALACRIGDDTELNKFRRPHRRASRRHRRGLPCRSPVVQQARRNPVPADNHRNLATLRLDLGYQRRLLLRGPLPTALNDNLAIHSKDSFWTVQKELRSARPLRLHAEVRFRPDAYSTMSSATALVRSLGRNGLARNAPRSRHDALTTSSVAFPEIVKTFKSGISARALRARSKPFMPPGSVKSVTRTSIRAASCSSNAIASWAVQLVLTSWPHCSSDSASKYRISS